MTESSAVLTWSGEVDFAGAADKERDVNRALASSPEQLVLDLSAVTFVDSSALGILVHANTRCAEEGVRLIVHHAPDTVRRAINLAGLDEVLRLD